MSDDPIEPTPLGSAGPPRSIPAKVWIAKAATVLALFIVMAFVYWQWRDELSLPTLAERETDLRRFLTRDPVSATLGAFVVYVLVTGLSLPGAAVMSLTIGWLFGFYWGLVLVSFASTTGAALAFLISRYLFRDVIQLRFAARLQGFNESLRREGAFYLFTLRLIPAIPFFVVNAVMGLTPLRLWTFWWVSQLGMLPGTIAYVYAGSTVPNLKTLAERGVSGIISPQLLIAFATLGLLPLIIRQIMQRRRASTVRGA